MDKTFKEKLEKLPIKTIQHPVGNTKYYAAVHVKSLIAQADKEFQELKSKIDWLNNLLDERNEEVLEKVRKMNEALPVVPEEVDKAIKYLKTQNNFATITDLKKLDILTEKGFWWLNDFQFKDRRFGFGGLNNKLFILSHLAVTGYQVEKPQLFYLKNKLTTSYLELDKTNDYFHHTMNPAPYYDMTRKSQFTQQEIDSMETGSYELVPVEDGE